MKKLISIAVFVPLAIVLIVLSVANRHLVTFNMDPINPAQPFLAFTMPFFVFLFLALLTGLFLGSMFTWFSQSKHRKFAREKKHEAAKWQSEAEEQKKLAEQLTAMIAASMQEASNQAGSDQAQSIAHIPFGVSKICSVQPFVSILPISQALSTFTAFIFLSYKSVINTFSSFVDTFFAFIQ